VVRKDVQLGEIRVLLIVEALHEETVQLVRPFGVLVRPFLLVQ
jgi:hypothetical protein